MLVNVERAARILGEYDDYLILSHANPDGDTLGCAYALCRILQKAGKRAKCLCADEIPYKMKFLTDQVQNQEFEHKTVVSVDVADRKLLGGLNQVYGDDVFLAIDHHGSRTEFAEFTLVDPDAAAACELIYKIAEVMDIPLDSQTAVCLYTGIATDTGCFRFSNTTSATHYIAHKLIDIGIPFEKINYRLFDMKSKGRMRLEHEIFENMEFYCEDRVAVSVLSLALINKYKGEVDVEDFNGLAGMPRQIEGVEVGVTIKQKDDNVFKISIRTSDEIDAAKICEKFDGGGHARAAGCTLEGTLDEVKARLLPAVIEAAENGGE